MRPRVEAEAARQGDEAVACDLGLLAQGVEDHDQQRHEIDDREKRQHRIDQETAPEMPALQPPPLRDHAER